MSHDYRRIWRDGLWDNNVVFAQLLALCPLLAVTGTATNGLGMGLATLGVMLLSSLVIALFRGLILGHFRVGAQLGGEPFVELALQRLACI